MTGQFTASFPAYPGTSQVAVTTPGTTNWRYMGSIGQVTSLIYSFACPGGCLDSTWTVMVSPSYRDQSFNPGDLVRITRGGHQVWKGKLDEARPSPSGWSFTATGDGARANDFVAYYTGTWPTGQPDDAINQAIGRGLPWDNPGVGSPSGIWLGQGVDPAAQKIGDLLNLVCTRGALTWYVNSQPGGTLGSTLSVFALPTAVNRLFVCTQPIPRTLGGYINTLFIRYQTAADSTNAGGSINPATFATTSVQNASSAGVHGVIEDFLDLTDAGVLTLSGAQAVGNKILQIYQAASFSDPFVLNYGQLLTTGGQPIDPGTDQAGTVAQVIATDYAYGGSVTPQFPITFPVGKYQWDDFGQVAMAWPFQSLDQSMSGLLAMENTVLAPITTATS